MFCSNCGTKLNEGARFCANCGTKVAATQDTEAASPAPPRPVRRGEWRRRHGFTTFWLWLSLIANALSAIFMLIAAADPDIQNEYLPMLSSNGPTVLFIEFLINAFASHLLLDWSRLGFWLMAVSAAVQILDPFSTGLETGVMPSLLSIAILFGVLRLRGKNGESAWKQCSGVLF